MNIPTRTNKSLRTSLGLAVGLSLLLWGGLPLTGLAQEDEDIPEGFKAESRPAPPSAEQIEAGKRVYFTKCVWCHGVKGSGDGPAADRLCRGRGISTKAHLRFGIRRVGNCL